MKKFFFLYIALFVFLVTTAQPLELSFNHISSEQGLSHTFVHCLASDYRGFMWIGTQNGLNKYDGYKVTVYKNNPNDTTSIRNNDVWYIYEDSKKNLWICTHQGIDLYDRENDRFIRMKMQNFKTAGNNFFTSAAYEDKFGVVWFGTAEGAYCFDRTNNIFKLYKHDPEDPGSISNSSAQSFCEDKNGNLWVAAGDKLNRFDHKTRTFKSYDHDPNSKSSEFYEITEIIADKNGNVVIGTRGEGLYMMEVDKETITHYRHHPDDSTSLAGNDIESLYVDHHGNLWVGVGNGGLHLFHPETGTFTRYVNDPNNPGSILNNTVSSIFEDASGMIWVGTHNGGVSFCNPYQQRFRQHKKEIGKNSLSHNIVRAIEEDENGNFWIGTDGGGLNYWERKSNKFTHYRHRDGEDKNLSSDYVLSLYKDSGGDLWIGTYIAGVNKLDSKTKTFTHYKRDPKDPGSISSNTVWDILEDEQKNLWFATREGGLAMLDRKTNKFTNYRNNPADEKSIISDWTICMTKDSKNNIWIGTYEGLSLFNNKTNTFTNFKDKNGKKGTNQINNIFEDRKGNIWVATSGGLKQFDQKTGTFTSYTLEDGLMSDLVQSILEDNQGNLWVTTLNGISRFDHTKKRFKNYSLKNEFLQNVQYITDQGEFVFGSTEGYILFHPDSIRDNSFIPPIYFTDFQLFNKPVSVGASSPLTKNINEAEEIVLTHDESVFSFEFAAINYLKSEDNQYAYKLEGFDKDWSYVGTRRSVTYTNLEPGQYILKVRGSNNDGIWNNKGASIRITILPPWWMTWWFRGLATLLVVLGIVGFYYIRSRSIRERNRFLEEEVKKHTAELKEANNDLAYLNRTKDKFFSIIAHDLKGPVKALVALTGYLKEETKSMGSEKQKNLTEHVDAAAHKVNKLLSDLLEWARTQSKQVKVEPSAIPVLQLLKENRELLSEQALQKQIEIKIDSEESHVVYADYNMVTTIVRNILSNSIKYSHPGGVIVLSSSLTSDSHVKIAIKDKGIGIPEEILSKLFSLEKNTSVKGTANETGTGLGMIISREFAMLNKGQIYAESKPGEGSTFYLVLPCPAVVVV